MSSLAPGRATGGALPPGNTSEGNPPESIHELESELKRIIQELEKEDSDFRERNLRKLKRAELLWDGAYNAYWSEIAHDWRVVDDTTDLGDSEIGLDADELDRNVNIYRAHGESIVAAVSASVPRVRFFPENADDPADISTARTFSKACKFIERENEAELLMVRCAYILFNQNFVAAYNYYETDEKYGMSREEIYDQVDVGRPAAFCSICGTDITTEVTQDLNLPALDINVLCPACGESAPPEVDQVPAFEEQVVDIHEEPKSKECIELYGPLHVKVPPYIRKISQAPYLIFELEQHASLMKAMYPTYRTKIQGSDGGDSERWARLNGESGTGLVTHKQVWLRPQSFYMLADENHISSLTEQFPKGCKISLVDDTIVEIIAESMDEHWTLSVSPIAQRIHAEPIGAQLIPIQEMETEMVNLTLKTIEYGISETFYDPEVLDGEEYKKQPAEPGMKYPVKKGLAGAPLDHAFYETRPAALSKEVEQFSGRLTQYGQFVTGDYPAVHGGQIQGGSGTFSEYEMSRNQALQRLSIIWKIINNFWPQVMKKAVVEFRNNLIESGRDEQTVVPQGRGYANLWLRRQEMMGQVGRVVAESSEQFPTSWVQRRGILMELLGMKNPAVDSALFHVENSSNVSDTIGFPDLFVPGEDDRQKQLVEIAELLKGQPSLEPPMIDPMTQMEMGPERLIPSVPTDDFDNHEIQAEICRVWLVSEDGLEARVDNPGGYDNVLAHYREHIQRAQPPMPLGPPGGNGAGPTGPKDLMIEPPPGVDQPPDDGQGVM